MNDAFLWAKNDAPVIDVEEWGILMALSETGDDDGCNCFQSYATIGDRAKLDPKTVYRRVKAMEARGILARGDQSVVANIRADNRPVVWDMQIPYSWFPNIERINRYRGQRGKKPLTPEDRPDLAPAPERKRRKDAGVKRGKRSALDEGTSSPVADGLEVQSSKSGETDVTHGLQERPDYKSSREGTTSPTTSLGVEVLSKGTVRTSSPPTPSAADAVESTPAQQRADPARRKTLDPSEIENQEGRITIPRDFFPDLTPWEQALHAECRRRRPEWPSAVLHKVLGMPQVRERTADNPELVWRAFMIGVNDRKRGDHQGTASPRRFLYEACPHWAAAADELRAEQERAAAGEPSVPNPAPVEPDPVEPAPARPAVPEQRAARVAPVSPGAPNAAYLAQKTAQAERVAARRAAEERAELERAERLAAALREAGVGGPVGAGATLGDPVLGEVPPAPALVPTGGNAATVR